MSAATSTADAAPVSVGEGDTPKFAVRLDNFEGPFDLLLGLIAKHKLDITQVALSRVTDEFIDYIKARGPQWDLEQTTEFLVVASTLLDLKAARLIPQAEVEDEDDLALLEARDLLFARLLQYRAYKQVAAMIAETMAREARQVPRTVGLEERYAGLLPEVLIGLGVDEFAALAAKALTPKPEPTLGLTHLHAPRVSVREQAAIVVSRLRRQRSTTFRALASDSPDTLTTVARFLSLLELFREGAVSFEQVSPLGELHVRWTGPDEGEFEITDEFDGALQQADPAGTDPSDSPGSEAADNEDNADHADHADSEDNPDGEDGADGAEGAGSPEGSEEPPPNDEETR